MASDVATDRQEEIASRFFLHLPFVVLVFVSLICKNFLTVFTGEFCARQVFVMKRVLVTKM